MTASEKRCRREFAERPRQVQAYFASVIPAGVSLVDELLKERRDEVEREERE